MKLCSLSLVECLRFYEIEPLAEANDPHPEYPASYGINYENGKYYHSAGNFKSWWMIDFKQKVTIHNYSFNSDSDCNYLQYWEAFVSNDNKTWTVVD